MFSFSALEYYGFWPWNIVVLGLGKLLLSALGILLLSALEILLFWPWNIIVFGLGILLYLALEYYCFWP